MYNILDPSLTIWHRLWEGRKGYPKKGRECCIYFLKMSRQGAPVMSWRQLWMVSSMTTLVSDKVHLFTGFFVIFFLTSNFEPLYFLKLHPPLIMQSNIEWAISSRQKSKGPQWVVDVHQDNELVHGSMRNVKEIATRSYRSHSQKVWLC